MHYHALCNSGIIGFTLTDEVAFLYTCNEGQSSRVKLQIIKNVKVSENNTFWINKKYFEINMAEMRLCEITLGMYECDWKTMPRWTMTGHFAYASIGGNILFPVLARQQIIYLKLVLTFENWLISERWISFLILRNGFPIWHWNKFGCCGYLNIILLTPQIFSSVSHGSWWF